MLVSVTGATGFIGRQIVTELVAQGYSVRALCRASSDRAGFPPSGSVEWVVGSLESLPVEPLLDGADALVHTAFWRQGRWFREAGQDLEPFVKVNLIGSIRLFEAACRADIRTVFISSGAVHDVVLEDRALDELHPCLPTTHYGAYKAALEQFVYSFGLGQGKAICSLRPCSVYGVARVVQESRFYELGRDVIENKPAHCTKGSKVVHVADVARAVLCLLEADPTQIAGQTFNCCDRYLSEWEVAQRLQRLCPTPSAISGQESSPKHKIEHRKLLALGFEFRGDRLLDETLSRLAADLP